MSGLIVSIICIAISVLCYKKVSNRSKNKGQGKIRAFITSLAMSFIVFMVSIGIGAGVVSQDKSTDAKASTAGSTEKTTANVYKCDKFDAITQTRQGTKHNSGYYSDKGVLVEYTISDNDLSSRMPIPDDKDSIDTAKFNEIAVDGSRKYGNSSSNYFVSVLNDSTIKVILVDFNHNGTITQICSK
ncbi:hypothetical protein ACLIXB_001333 [Yersinia enterocolitica]|uniref:hypothetical protein n=1 Tax=Yersinia enterocolitica TaxID=630 RepID=UPI0005DAC6DD|nr:hypothetical protein [Yersinia enterocolitica]EKN3401917.1 hypothetical protein [Yersinia enterocolitica]EKN3634358.1 hypothetical protein [Yersinia enterocolitica]EKN3715334.1 hypothetical protein [Yersinia enterocolitica]EKN3723083.1 hypothetical protein [Yersinia enterocolitica]EKN3994037.1 hypothetical protein [Yersinia enterocolitica]